MWRIRLGEFLSVDGVRTHQQYPKVGGHLRAILHPECPWTSHRDSPCGASGREKARMFLTILTFYKVYHYRGASHVFALTTKDSKGYQKICIK